MPIQRQVNWVLWSDITEIALIVIPEEAELLIQKLLDEQPPCTRLLLYAAPVTRKMVTHFNNLTYHGIPNLPEIREAAPIWLRIELGIFAGRLYFPWEEYEPLLEFLGFRTASNNFESSIETDPEALKEVDEKNEELEENGSGEEAVGDLAKQKKSFTKKPLTFLQEWLALRRKGQDFSNTPMGYLCQGKPMGEDHPFFTKLK